MEAKREEIGKTPLCFALGTLLRSMSFLKQDGGLLYFGIDLLFFDVQEKHQDLVDKNYNYKPFVGFYDMIATSRSWGLLKEFAKQE